MILMLGQMISTIISALGVMIVARILGSVNYGVLNIAIIRARTGFTNAVHSLVMTEWSYVNFQPSRG